MVSFAAAIAQQFGSLVDGAGFQALPIG